MILLDQLLYKMKMGKQLSYKEKSRLKGELYYRAMRQDIKESKIKTCEVCYYGLLGYCCIAEPPILQPGKRICRSWNKEPMGIVK